MKIRQKRAIGYAIRERANRRREAFIIEREGSLDEFKKSGYKTLTWYIKSKFNTNIY